MKDIINFKLLSLEGGGFKGVLDSDSKALMGSLYEKGKTDLHFERVSEKKARSNQHNRYYWTVIMRIVAEYLPKMDTLIDYSDNGAKSYDRIHRYLILCWALETGNDKMIKYNKTFYDGKWIDVPAVSFSFESMSHEDSIKYTKWIEARLIAVQNCGFEMILEREKMEVQ